MAMKRKVHLIYLPQLLNQQKAKALEAELAKLENGERIVHMGHTGDCYMVVTENLGLGPVR